MSRTRRVRFEKFGRSYHLRIHTAEDLAAACELDEALWVATSAALSTLTGDEVFLRLLDIDGNGRVLSWELTEAIQWLLGRLSGTEGVAAGSDVLRIGDVNTDDPDGAAIADSARKMLARMEKPGAHEITLEEVRRIKMQVEGTPVSEAGVVLPGASQREDVRALLSDVIATVGGAPHPSGEEGVGAAEFEDFLAQARAYLDWNDRGLDEAGRPNPQIFPLGEATPQALSLYASLRGRIDEYFAQCEAIAFDPRAAEQIGPSRADLASLDLCDPAAIAKYIEDAPLARPTAEQILPLSEGVNPRHAVALTRLADEVVAPLLGERPGALTPGQWRQIKQRLGPYEAWVGSKAGEAVEPLGVDRLRECLRDDLEAEVRRLIAASAETAFVLDNIRLVEKLVLFQGRLLEFANNFISFPHLYDPRSRALFDLGHLVMDGRRFNFCARVDDRGRHSNVAASGSLYILYVEVQPPAGPGTPDSGPPPEQKFEIAVPVTSGGVGNLCVGKRGVFRDMDGRELDAQVIQIVPNPVSLIEALLAPFQRIAKALSTRIESMTATAEARLDAATSRTLQGEPPPPAPGGSGTGGMVAAGGVALAAVGSAVAYIGKTVSNMQNQWVLLVVVAVAIAAVLLPTSIVAIYKLRRRDLSVILEGSGWAINARMRLTRRLSRYFTMRPRRPGSMRLLHGVWVWVLLAALAAVGIGVLGVRLVGG